MDRREDSDPEPSGVQQGRLGVAVDLSMDRLAWLDPKPGPARKRRVRSEYLGCARRLWGESGDRSRLLEFPVRKPAAGSAELMGRERRDLVLTRDRSRAVYRGASSPANHPSHS